MQTWGPALQCKHDAWLLLSTVHNVYIGQYLFLATEQGEINTTHPNYDIIQHILIPACSVARKTPFMQFFNIFPSFTL